MKKVNLHIQSPCNQEFDSFLKTKSGGFCEQCQFGVIDFSKMSTREIAEYLSKKKHERVCGKFEKHQLGEHVLVENNKYLSLVKGIFYSTSIFFSSALFGQKIKQDTLSTDYSWEIVYDKTDDVKQNINKDIIVKGRVLDSDSSQIQSYSKIFIDSTSCFTYARKDGTFTLKVPKELSSSFKMKIFNATRNYAKEIALKSEQSDTINLGDIFLDKYKYQSRFITYCDFRNIEENKNITIGSVEIIETKYVSNKQNSTPNAFNIWKNRKNRF